MLPNNRASHLHRDLLLALTWKEVTIKYKQSVMGFLWAILMPGLIVSAGVLIRFVFSKMSGTPLTTDDVALVTVKSVPWAFFVASVRFCSTSLVSNANLVAKIYMPREVFPLASVLSQLVDLCMASVALAIVLSITKVGISVYLLWVPLLLTILVLFASGVGLFVSASALFLRDVKYLVEIFVTFAIFFTPVFYEVEMFGAWSRLLLLNPVAPILEALADVIVHQQPPAIAWVLYSAGISILLCGLSWLTFKRLEPYFAQVV